MTRRPFLTIDELPPQLTPILFALIADLWYIRFKERALRRKFGEAYEACARRRRRWI